MELYKNTGPIDCSTPLQKVDLSDKTAIVTGAASGIGREYARALARSGALVVIADIDEGAGLALCRELGGEAKAVFAKCDVTAWQDQLSVFRRALEVSPRSRIDIVVNNAGIGGRDDVAVDDSELDEPEEPKLWMTQVDSIGAMLTVKLALFYFRRQAKRDEGEQRDYSLVIQGSANGYVDSWNIPQYAFAKFGLRGIFRSLRHTEKRYGIRTNFIAPWYIDTAILSEAGRPKVIGSGVGLAAVEDAGQALLRIVGDRSVNGRAIAIMPRDWPEAPNGYMDLDIDDPPEGTLLARMMRQAEKITLYN